MKAATIGVILKKKLKRAALYITAAALLLPALAQPARADVLDVSYMTVVHAWETIQRSMDQLQRAWASQIQAINDYLKTQVQTMLADSAATNNRNTSNLQVLQNKAADKLAISGTSACAIAYSSSDKDNDHDNVKKFGAALAQANKNRPDTPTVNVQELKNKCQLGMIDTSNTSDPDNATYKRLFGSCTPPGGAAARPGADRDIRSVIDPLQYYVPNNFPAQLADGTYQMLPAPLTGGKDYSPFVAAYTFCQNITPHEPVAQQGTGAATVDDLGAGAKRDAQSRKSVVGDCYKYLMERAQYDSSNPIQGYNSQGQLTSLHLIQFQRCEDDHADKLLTDDQLATCQQNGRSDLQADHDKAYMLGVHSEYTTHVLPALDTNTQETLKAMARQSEAAFDARLMMEESYLTNSISVASGVGSPGNAAWSQAVTNGGASP